MTTLQPLINKLDPQCLSALEKAAALCVTRSHYHIDIAHWLLAFYQADDKVLQNTLGDAARSVEKELLRTLDHCRSGSDQTPTISEFVIKWIHEAWLITSLEQTNEKITLLTLLLALLKNSTLQQLVVGISPSLSKLDPASLAQEYKKQQLPQQANSTAAPIASEKSALGKYTSNLNKLAASGKIDNIIGRDLEVEQMLDILSRRRQNNVILTGDPGVGKTAVVEGLALLIQQNKVPSFIAGTQILSLDLAALQAGASVKGEFENRLKQIMQEIEQSNDSIILFIDEAHMLIGAGNSAGQGDAANLLKPALARGQLRCIAATTWKEYKQYFEKDSALTRRFQVVKVDEPSADTAARMLRSLQPNLEQHHHVTILDEALTTATNLAKRYLTERKLPDSAISVLDTACARLSNKQQTLPGKLQHQQQYLNLLNTELESLTKEQNLGVDNKAKIKELKQEIARLEAQCKELENLYQQQQKLVEQIKSCGEQLLNDNQLKAAQKTRLKKQLSKAKNELTELQSQHNLTQAFVDEQAIASVLEDWTGIPVNRMQQDQMQILTHLSERLHESVLGQPHALAQIQDCLLTSGAKLNNPDAPLGVFMLLGPSGVGKTETALALAREVYGSEANMTTINMSEFKEAHKISTLAGSPPGYVGFGEGGILTEAVRRKPYSLILLDEMEKAHPNVQDFFYQVFDKGTMTDSQGQVINFKNTLIIMTSNACSEEITQLVEKHPDIQADEILSSLEDKLTKHFKPAFLGRINLIPYAPLSTALLQDICQLKLNKICQRAKREHHINIVYQKNVVKWICEQCEYSYTGARELDKIIRRYITPTLSRCILQQLSEKKALPALQISVKQGDLIFKAMSKPSKAKTGKKREAATV